MNIGFLLLIIAMACFFTFCIGVLLDICHHEVLFVAVGTAIISAVLTPIFIIVADTQSKRWATEYQVQKITIEQSLDNEDLGGFERFELLKLATELNTELASNQFDYQQWYTLTFDKNVYEGLEYINLS